MIDVLHVDDACVVVNKPGGLLTQSPPSIDSLEDRVRVWAQQQQSATSASSDRKPYVGVPHRLDRPVSGAMVFARNQRAARRLSEQFQGRLVDKRYWVLVEGHVPDDQGTIRDWVRKVPDTARAEVVDVQHPDARVAVLHFRVLRRDTDLSWLSVKLETGRMHQIRLQMSHAGFPVLGDSQYGATTRFGPQVDDHRARWIALHSRRLSFAHPKSRAMLEVEAPLPSHWTNYRDASFWDVPALRAPWPPR